MQQYFNYTQLVAHIFHPCAARGVQLPCYYKNNLQDTFWNRNPDQPAIRMFEGKRNRTCLLRSGSDHILKMVYMNLSDDNSWAKISILLHRVRIRLPVRGIWHSVALTHFPSLRRYRPALQKHPSEQVLFVQPGSGCTSHSHVCGQGLPQSEYSSVLGSQPIFFKNKSIGANFSD